MGQKNPMNCKELRQKNKQAILDKYGVDNVAKVPEIQQKTHETKKRNGSYGRSKEEDYIFQKLVSKFPDTQRQYMSEEYPFACDFFIPEHRLYIEYQGFVSHGNHPYNPENKQDQLLLGEGICYG